MEDKLLEKFNELESKLEQLAGKLNTKELINHYINEVLQHEESLKGVQYDYEIVETVDSFNMEINHPSGVLVDCTPIAKSSDYTLEELNTLFMEGLSNGEYVETSMNYEELEELNNEYHDTLHQLYLVGIMLHDASIGYEFNVETGN